MRTGVAWAMLAGVVLAAGLPAGSVMAGAGARHAGGHDGGVTRASPVGRAEATAPAAPARPGTREHPGPPGDGRAPDDTRPAAPDRSEDDGRHVFARALMGTGFRIVIPRASADSAGARKAALAAFSRIAELERVLSDYDPESELSQLAATAGDGRPVPVSDDLWAVLWRAKEWSERTGGAFDVTVGPLTRLWRRAARRGSVPSPREVEVARSAVGHEGLDPDPARRTVRLMERGMRLDVGGIGKGYAADAALDRLGALGFPAALVDAGGDIVAGAPPPGEDGWRVELPWRSVESGSGACVMFLAHAAVATSGDAERSVEVDGVRHSHVLDPRTGASLTHRRVVTVLAPTATEADVLASALGVLSPAEGRALVRQTPGAAARILEPDGDSWRGPTLLHGAHLRFPNCASDHET